MTDHTRPKHRDRPPRPITPADQPTPPKHPERLIVSDAAAPALPSRPECQRRDWPVPSTAPTSLESLIEQQRQQPSTDERLRIVRDLEAWLTKAQHESAKYTRERYETLKARWLAQDAAIAELIEDMVRRFPSWPGIVESWLCPLVDAIRQAEHELHGDGRPPSDLHNQFDLVYWHTREKHRSERRLSRIKALVEAWGTLSDSIEKVLNDNALLIAESHVSLDANDDRAVLDILLGLVPDHLAVAPPATSPELTTQIAREYTRVCVCDTHQPEDGCDPDIDVANVLMRSVGPHACLVEPHEYLDVVCCLAQWYASACGALAAAESRLAAAERKLQALKDTVEDGRRRLSRAPGPPAWRPR